MDKGSIRHEIVSHNPDIDVRFYLSVDGGSYVPPHWHNSLELVYMLEGSMTVIYEDKKVKINPTEISIVNPRVIHAVSAVKNKALVLQIPNSIFEKYVPNYNLIRFNADINPKNAVDKTKLDRLKKIFYDMYIVYDVRPNAYLLRFNSLLYDLLYSLVHSYSYYVSEKAAEDENKKLCKIKDMMFYIEKNHKEKISTNNVASAFGYNSDYAARIFKEAIGMTMTQYLYEIRLNEVNNDLHFKNKTINDILEYHGCTNYKYFMKLFKERYGCTLKKKREEYLKKSE